MQAPPFESLKRHASPPPWNTAGAGAGSEDGTNQSPPRRKRARGERGCVLVRTREGLQEAIYFETATLRGKALRQKVAFVAKCAEEAVGLCTPEGVAISDFADVWPGSLVLFQTLELGQAPAPVCAQPAPLWGQPPAPVAPGHAASLQSGGGDFFVGLASGACASVADLALLAERSAAAEASPPPGAHAPAPACGASAAAAAGAGGEGMLRPSGLSGVFADLRLRHSCEAAIQQAAAAQAHAAAAPGSGGGGLWAVHVKTLSGRRLSLHLPAGARVGDAKGLVAEQEGLPAEAITLVFGGRVLLLDGHALRDYAVHPGALLFMIPAAL